MRGWLSGVVFIICLVVTGVAAMPSPARAQVTEASVIQQCGAKTALPNANWTYKVSFIGWTDIEWSVQNPFPGAMRGICTSS